MQYWEYSQCIVDRDVAIKNGEFYYPPKSDTRPSFQDIVRKFNLATNPVTKSVYRDMIIRQLTDHKQKDKTNGCRLSVIC